MLLGPGRGVFSKQVVLGGKTLYLFPLAVIECSDVSNSRKGGFVLTHTGVQHDREDMESPLGGHLLCLMRPP